MLQAKNITLSFADQTLLDNISFNINYGERVGLVGRNGSGKTSLFKLITGEMHPDSGEILLPKNYTIGYLKQHLKFTGATVVDEACLGLKEDEKDQVWKAEKMLMGLGFSMEDQQRSPNEFSGGFQVRLNLAKVLLAEPHLLLLDEPTNYLDIVSIRWLIKFLRSRENELMIITHDREFMDEVSTHTMAIHRQKVRKIEGDTGKLFNQISQDEIVYEQTRMRDDKKRKDAEAFIERFRAQASRASMVQSRIKALEKMEKREELEEIAELGFKFNYLNFEAKMPLRVENLSFGYTQDKLLINGLSFDVSKDDRICVIGKNGKGKSTLLKLLVGELEPLTGTVKRHPASSIGYFGQTNIDRLNAENTVVQELQNIRPDMKLTEIRNTCGAMMFSGDNALKKISVLSGGERSRVSLGKILLNQANLLLLDEPTNHLDIQSCDSMIVALDEFPGAVIIVTHSELFLHHLANRLIVFNGDKVEMFEGTYQDFLDRVGWEEEAKKRKKEKKPVTPANDAIFAQAEAKRQKKRLAAQIEDAEKKINKQEAELEAAEAELAASYAGGNSNVIQALQKKAHDLRQAVDAGYSGLEAMIKELDALTSKE